MKTSLHFRLGNADQHTVYEGEATSILLASHLILRETHVQSVNIYVDNCALIIAILLTKPTPGHYLIDAFHKAVKVIKNKMPGISIQNKWIPAHEDVEGNKKVDSLAKKAITNNSSDLSKLPKLLTSPLPFSSSAAKQAFRSKTKCKMQEVWSTSPHFTYMSNMDLQASST